MADTATVAAASAAENQAGDSASPTFLEDPESFLSALAAKPPSQNSVDQLGGPVSKWFANKSPEQESTLAPVAAAYLHAAAVHLPETSLHARNAQLDTSNIKTQYEVITTVGVCATLCKNRRGSINGSGILPTLANLMLKSQTQYVNQLSLVEVEFLQCALLTEQYRYAARLVAGTWPRPNMTVNVKLVLRYFYLRGMIHLGCNDFGMAHRCFWTCLIVPAKASCNIAIEAWKKLVLVQCIMNDGSNPKANKAILPKSMPTCLARILGNSKETFSRTFSSSVAKRSTRRNRGPPEFHVDSTSIPQKQQQARSASKRLQDAGSESTACYMEIIAAFYKRDKSRLEALLVEHNATLQSDGNLGLVRQCRTQLINNQVRHISNMYSVVSVSRVASLLGIDSTASGDDAATAGSQQQEEVVAWLLMQSGVTCEIQDDSMVVFHDQKDSLTASNATTSMATDVAEWMALQETIRRLDVSILTSPRYQAFVRKNAVGPGSTADAKLAMAALSAAGPRGVDDI